jgi:two-component system torCAD operon response regulator TorR
MLKRTKILVVDDDKRMCRLIINILKEGGYSACSAHSAAEMIQYMHNTRIDLVLLDLRLPDADGFNLLKTVQEMGNVPVIIVSGKTDPMDKILCLETGADDYVTKPFHERVLLARVRAVLRRHQANEPTQRSEPQAESSPRPGAILFKVWILSPEEQQLYTADYEAVPLPPGEFRLLADLVTHPGVSRSRDELMMQISGREWDPEDRTVDVLVNKLRRKLEANPQKPEIIKTARGIGYRLGVPVQQLAMH